MKKLFFILSLGYIFSFLTPSIAQEPVQITVSERVINREGKTFRVHTVERGQTLYRISKAYDVPINEITRFNPEAATALKPGMELLIPLAAQTEEKPVTSYIFHVTRKGETLEEIAAIYGVPKEAILQLNPELKGARPTTGQTLKIPMDYSGYTEFRPDTINRLPGQEFREHVVAEKETLYGISRLYNVTIADLIEWNPFVQDGLKVGQVLRIGQSVPDVKISDFIEYHVQKKESLYGIARKNRISIDSLKMFNPGLTEQIKEGQIILIPRKGVATSFITHTTSSRENLENIAQKYQVDKKQLEEANPQLGNKVDKNIQVKIPVEKTEKLVETPESNAEPSAVEVIGNAGCGLSYKYKNEEFKIVVMFPYPRLKNSPGAKSKAAERQRFKYLTLYEGVLIALDSLEKEGMRARVITLDAGYDVEDTRRILNNPELKKADIIIALAFSKNFTLIADFAKKNQIPIINVFSKRDEILTNNSFVIRSYPSANYQTERVLEFLKMRPQRQNIILVRSNKYQHQKMYEQLRSEISAWVRSGELPVGSHFTTIGDTLSNLFKALKPGYHNYLIALSENEAFSINLLRNLHDRKDTIRYSVIGLPSWDNMKNIENQLVVISDLHLVTPWFVDYSSSGVQGFINTFRNRFNAEPDDLAMTGFDMMWYAGHALMMEGKNFLPCMENIRINGLLSRYHFQHKNGDGYVNTFWNVYHYPGYRPVLLNR
ncbi:MAG: LysM peptidoglycan-binding domain-containing protein [Bacteroidales bacterium]